MAMNQFLSCVLPKLSSAERYFVSGNEGSVSSLLSKTVILFINRYVVPQSAFQAAWFNFLVKKNQTLYKYYLILINYYWSYPNQVESFFIAFGGNSDVFYTYILRTPLLRCLGASRYPHR
ncbi:hypothetical protein VCR29J2_970064 [Vibrio coralliirubri]|nr:hypothetical protein VCR29J2_970064 [Vibrio coralliirubri]